MVWVWDVLLALFEVWNFFCGFLTSLNLCLNYFNTTFNRRYNCLKRTSVFQHCWRYCAQSRRWDTSMKIWNFFYDLLVVQQNSLFMYLILHLVENIFASKEFFLPYFYWRYGVHNERLIQCDTSIVQESLKFLLWISGARLKFSLNHSNIIFNRRYICMRRIFVLSA